MGYELAQMTERYPKVAPVKMGSLGYTGFEALFVLDAPRQAAYQTEGLAIEYYKSWDSTWHKPDKYYTPYTSIPDSELMPCEDTVSVNDVENRAYAKHYGYDADGLEEKDGKLHFKCTGGRWWLSPACRLAAAPEQCVAVVTGGNGWGFQEWAMKATEYNMSVAVAVAADWARYQSVPAEFSSLFYWWWPDPTFVPYGPREIQFPRNDPDEWNDGNRRTMNAYGELVKLAYYTLKADAPNAYELGDAMVFSAQTVSKMLKDFLAKGDTTVMFACDWLKANERVWKKWIPDRTKCAPGHGIVDFAGRYLDSTISAVDCKWCQPGNRSVPLENTSTMVCLPCGVGSFSQDPGQEECTPCQPGSFTDRPGQRQCEGCRLGMYQPLTGQTSCVQCTPPLTTMMLKASSSADCLCPQNMFRPLDRNASAAPCLECPEGMHCEQGSDAMNFPWSSQEASSLEQHDLLVIYPRPKKGYWTTFDEPLSVYRCLDEQSCPGGDSEMCGAHMEGIACGTCVKGFYSGQQGLCNECSDVEKSKILFPVLPLIIGPVVCYFMHRFSRDPVEMWLSPQNGMMTTMYVLLVYLQTLGAVNSCYLSYPEIAADMLDITVGFVDILSLLRPECATFADYKTSFMGKLFLPAYILFIFAGTYFVLNLLDRLRSAAKQTPTDTSVPSALAMDRDVVFNCYLSLYSTFFIGIAAQTFQLFQCYEHPNTTKSLRAAPHILCDSDAWQEMAGMAFAAILVFCLGAFVLFVYIIILTPTRFQDIGFRKRWKFLFLKFRPTAWWWMLVMLVKGIWLSLTTVAFIEPVGQISWLFAGVSLYLYGTVSMRPWREIQVTRLDIVMHFSLLFSISFLDNFTQLGEVSPVEVARAMTGIAIVPCFLTALVLLILLRRLKHPETYQQRLQIAESMCTTFSQMTDEKVIAGVLGVLPRTDLNTLNAAKHILLSEVFWQKSEKSWWHLAAEGTVQCMRVRENNREWHRASYSSSSLGSSSCSKTSKVVSDEADVTLFTEPVKEENGVQIDIPIVTEVNKQSDNDNELPGLGDGEHSVRPRELRYTAQGGPKRPLFEVSHAAVGG